MPNTNAGPAVSSFVNEVPLRGTFDQNSQLIQILGPGQSVALDPSTLSTSANLAASGGAGLVGFLQSGVGAVNTTMQAKAREILSVKDSSAVGDGSDDVLKIKVSLSEADKRNGATLNFNATATGYGFGRPYANSQRGLPVPANVSLKGDNTKLVLLDNSDFIFLGRLLDRADTTYISFYGVTAGSDYAQITADTTNTSTALSVIPGNESAFVAGDLVYVRLGQAVYDSAEPDWFYYAKVLGTASGSVTLDRPTGYAMSVAATPNDRQRRIIKVNGIPQNQVIDGFYLQGATSGQANAEFGIHFRYARNITMRNISGRDVGPGLIGGQFGENLLIQNVSIDNCANRGQGSKGRMFSFAECKGVTVNNYRAENFDGLVAFVEGASEQVRFTEGVVVNNAPTRDNSASIFFLAGGSDLHIDGLRLEGNPCSVLQTSTNAKLNPPFLRNVTCTPSFSPAFSSVPGYFEVDHVDENVKMGSWFNFGKKKRFTLEVNLLASQGLKSFALPHGVFTKITVLCTNKTGLTGLALADDSLVIQIPNNGSLPGLLTNNIPYTFQKLGAFPWYLFGNGHSFTNPGINRVLFYQSDATIVAGAKIYLDIDYFPAATPTAIEDVQAYKIVS